MKRKILLLITLCLFAYAGISQQSEGYIRNAVPPFDNETGEIDMSKVEFLPIRLYKPAPDFQPAQNRYGDNNVLSVTDNADIQVFPSAASQHEQHMTVSKINPNNIILSSNTPNYMGYYVSQDGGATWFGSDNMPDGIGTSGDPTTGFNADGHIFLQTIYSSGFKAFKSTDQGNTWPGPVQYTYSPASFDKEMMAVDNLPGSPYLNNIYTAWTDFAGTYKVLFTRSTNNGASYSPNINLHNSWGQGTGVATGVNGEVYVCWANYSTGGYPADGLGFSRSTNGGVSFTDLTPAFPYVGIRPNNSPNPLFNNTRVNDFPSIAVDKSCGPYRGRIYTVVGAKQNGTGKAVSYLRYSSNQGNSWSPAVEVNISSGRQNWFPWVTVDDATGTVSVAYLSLDEATGFATNTYLAYSFDGGSTWSNIKVSDVSHIVAAIPGFASGYCGDYIANTAWGNKNYVAWNDNRTGNWKNYFSRVDFSQLGLFSSNTDLNINGPVNLTLPTATQLFYRAVGNISTPVASSFAAQSGTSVTML
ncbi:MAG: sialidase family protein, partial [Bacteroidia bacterium]